MNPVVPGYGIDPFVILGDPLFQVFVGPVFGLASGLFGITANFAFFAGALFGF